MFYFPRSMRKDYGNSYPKAYINQYNNNRQINYPMDDDQPMNNRRPMDNEPLNNRRPMDNEPLNNRRPMDNEPLNNRRPMDNEPLNNRRPMDNEPLNIRRPMDNNQPLNNRRPMDINQPVDPRTPLDFRQPMDPSAPMNDFYQPQMDYNQPYLIDEYNPEELREALVLIKDAIEGEREDELFYNDLIALAPDQEQKDMITAIRDDESKHNVYFRDIYEDLTGEVVEPLTDVSYEKPETYLEGIKKALLGELGAVEKYRVIYNAMPNKYFRDLLFEIITDELKHGSLYNYVFNIN